MRAEMPHATVLTKGSDATCSASGKGMDFAASSPVTAGGMTRVPNKASNTSILPISAKLMSGVVFEMINGLTIPRSQTPPSP